MTQTADILRKGEIPQDILDAAKAIAEQPWLTRVERDRMTVQIAQAILAERQREQWQPIETAPQTGFFLVHSPDHAGVPMTVKAEIFHDGRKPGTPHHLSFNHFKHWMPCPPEPKGGEA